MRKYLIITLRNGRQFSFDLEHIQFKSIKILEMDALITGMVEIKDNTDNIIASIKTKEIVAYSIEHKKDVLN